MKTRKINLDGMIFIAILNEEQKDKLNGKFVQPSWKFYPEKTSDGNWFISEEEIINSIFPENDWIKELSLIEYIPPVKISNIILSEL